MNRRLANEAIRDNWRELGIVHFIKEKIIYIPVNNMWTEEENLLTVVIKPIYTFRYPSVTYNGKNMLIFYRELSDCTNKTIRDDI